MRTHLNTTVVALAAALAAAAPAQAATPAVTAQAQEANAAFLAYAPPPPGGSGALCLVDTGVHSNPDTAPGLVSATAVDGGTGNDVDPGGHGTTMAMIASAAGNGMIGAWPQIKIVSVRATNVPNPGQEPTFEFNNYADGINRCTTLAGEYHIHAIDLALSSAIPPTPDQAANFANRLAAANLQNIAVVAAAGNAAGAIEEPAIQPGVLAVGAGTAQGDQLSDGAPGSPCSFSATQSLTFYAPGCGLDEADPVTDQPTCCGNGTSQASAFAAAVTVALMSYDPTLSYSKAEQLLVSTATDGNLNVAAAFQADGLGSIVTAGNANIPQPTTPPTTPTTTTPTVSKKGLVVQEAKWAKNALTIVVSGLGKNRLSIELEYKKHVPRKISSHATRTVIRTGPPRLVLLRVFTGAREDGGPITVHPT